MVAVVRLLSEHLAHAAGLPFEVVWNPGALEKWIEVFGLGGLQEDGLGRWEGLLDDELQQVQVQV